VPYFRTSVRGPKTMAKPHESFFIPDPSVRHSNQEMTTARTNHWCFGQEQSAGEHPGFKIETWATHSFWDPLLNRKLTLT
jgi:hypothetical protein